MEDLVALGAKVIALDDFSTGKSENLIGGHLSDAKLLQGDVRTFDFDSLGRVDGIFHEAARALIPSFQDPYTDLAVNTGGTIRILEYARKWKIKVVHASTGSIYGNPIRIPITEDHPLNPISPYGASKLASEGYCRMYHREFGLDVCMLRYFNVYGPKQTVGEDTGVIPIFVKRALGKSAITIFGDGKQTRDFLNVHDVAKANLLAYKSDNVAGKSMNIGGGGNEISILELAHLVMELCGFKADPIFKQAKPGDISRLVADNSLAKQLMGYIPSVTLGEGLAQYIEFAKSK